MEKRWVLVADQIEMATINFFLHYAHVLLFIHCHIQFLETPWTVARQASLFFTISWSLHKFMSIESVMPSNHLILRCPLLLPPSIFLSIRVFSNELVLHIRQPKYWSFSITLPNECSRLIAFRIDWFDLLAVQGTLKSLLQQHSLKALNKSKMVRVNKTLLVDSMFTRSLIKSKQWLHEVDFSFDSVSIECLLCSK